MAYVNLLDVIYPVGSLYCSYNSTSPATIIGGTWESVYFDLVNKATILTEEVGGNSPTPYQVQLGDLLFRSGFYHALYNDNTDITFAAWYYLQDNSPIYLPQKMKFFEGLRSTADGGNVLRLRQGANDSSQLWFENRGSSNQGTWGTDIGIGVTENLPDKTKREMEGLYCWRRTA